MNKVAKLVHHAGDRDTDSWCECVTGGQRRTCVTNQLTSRWRQAGSSHSGLVSL